MPEGPRELRLVITVDDHDAAVNLLRDVLGLREEARFADDNGGLATLLHAGRATVEVGDEAHAAAIDELEVGRRVAGPLRLAFEVGDATAAYEQLLAAGAGPIAPPTATPWGSVNARMHALDGQQVTLWSADPRLVPAAPLDGPVELADPDPGWAAAAAGLGATIRAALGPVAVVVAHAGSTSVPGLPAKPIIDLVLGVPDPTDEASYVPALAARGYVLHAREPEWHEHRLLRRTDPAVNLHVFAVGSTEIDRMLAFRDQLRRDPGDRARYLEAKQRLAARTWPTLQDYADAKSDVVEEVLRRAVAHPSAVRDVVVLVGATGSRALAAELAAALALPLLAAEDVLPLLAADATAADADAVVLALARTSGGAVLRLSSARAPDLGALPYRVVEATATSDVARLVRTVRQVAAAP